MEKENKKSVQLQSTYVQIGRRNEGASPRLCVAQEREEKGQKMKQERRAAHSVCSTVTSLARRFFAFCTRRCFRSTWLDSFLLPVFFLLEILELDGSIVEHVDLIRNDPPRWIQVVKQHPRDIARNTGPTKIPRGEEQYDLLILTSHNDMTTKVHSPYSCSCLQRATAAHIPAGATHA